VVRKALSDERKLAFAYADKEGRGSNRVVWPVAVGFFDEVRMLAAWCETREAFRHFRLDRMASAAVLDERPLKPRGALLKEWRQAEGLG
jgi:predicted DNA-binding transcriptional regulator YafY